MDGIWGKKKGPQVSKSQDNGKVSIFSDRASGYDVLSTTTATAAHSRHRHAHGGKCGCQALFENPSSGCQPSAPYKLHRIRIRRKYNFKKRRRRERERASEGKKHMETPKIVTEGSKEGKK